MNFTVRFVYKSETGSRSASTSTIKQCQHKMEGLEIPFTHHSIGYKAIPNRADPSLHSDETNAHAETHDETNAHAETHDEITEVHTEVGDESEPAASAFQMSSSRAERNAANLVGSEGIPIPRSEYRKKGNLVGGSSMTCMPDATAMVVSDLGIPCSYFEARNFCMPGWRNPNTPTPSMLRVTEFYQSKKLCVFSRSELICNPLALFRQTTGVFHLVFRLKIKSGETRKHAAVYNATESVLKDNQPDADPVLIEAADRVSKLSARLVFKLIWPSVTSFEMTHVYHVSFK